MGPPGQWKIQYGGQPEDNGFTIMPRNGGGVIAECWRPVAGKNDRVVILVNAHLIVSVPAMLSHLEQIGFIANDPAFASDAMGWIAAEVRDAILKSRGDLPPTLSTGK